MSNWDNMSVLLFLQAIYLSVLYKKSNKDIFLLPQIICLYLHKMISIKYVFLLLVQ